jgi:hypothetical protein
VDDSANVFEDLELILDRITPLYKHRMDDLPGQLQAIMDAIAMSWDAITTKDIAAKVRLESKAVAAQLKILENNSLIRAIPVDRKNKLYMITERFFNIWYLMRYGKKKNREQVRFLVRFLEEWCSPEDIAQRIYKHIALARGGALHSKGTDYMCETPGQWEPSQAVAPIGQSVKHSSDIRNTYTPAVCSLWNNRYDESVRAFRQFLDFESFDEFESDMTLYLIFLMAKKQHHLLLDLFKDERYRLRERFKPVYYALMQRMKDEYPKEYKKMGEELRQTVEEVLAEADKMAKAYA